MKKLTFIFLLTYLFFVNGYSQNVNIVKHNFESFHDFPQNVFFAEDGDAHLWVLQNGGFSGDVLSKYNGESWENISFELCGNCTYDIAANRDGVIYLSTRDGFFAYENENWISKSGEIIANSKIVFDNQNRLWFTHAGTPNNLGVMNTDGSIEIISEIEGTAEQLSVNPEGQIWFVNNQEIVSYFDGNIMRFNKNANYLSAGPNGRTYFLDFNGSIGYVENGNILEDQFQNASNGFQATSLSVDQQNNYMWIGQQGIAPGVMQLNLLSGISNLISADDIYTEGVGITNASFVSSTGSLWVGRRFEPEIVELQPGNISSTDDLKQELNIFPNPVQNTLTLSLDNLNEVNETIDILNSSGSIVKTFSMDFSSKRAVVDVSSLTPGIHFLRLRKSNLQIRFIKI